MTLTPEQIAERLARKCATECAKQVGMYDLDFHRQRTYDVINNFIDLGINTNIPLVELFECVQQLRKYDTVTLMGEQLRNPELAALDLKLKQLL